MKLLQGLLLPLFFVMTLAQAATPIEADRVIAVVNNEAITSGELQAKVRQVTRQLRQQNTELPPGEILGKQILERLIVDRAQLQQAKEDGVKVDDAQLDATLLRIAESNHLSPQQFRATLEKDGVSWANFREDVRDEMLIARLRDKEVEGRIVISDNEVDNYLANSQGNGTDEFLIQHIFLRVPEQASPEQLQKLYAKAQQVLEKLTGGLPFAQAAASYSDGSEALNGGTVGWRSLDRVPSLFADSLNKMQPGQVSPILRSPAGFHILRLADRRGGNSLPTQVQQTRARHILIKTNELISETEARHKLEVLKERLDHGADFAELARQFSGDLSSTKGGDLGWIYPGDTVPEFEQAMNALKPGEISQPIRSPFGFHLIQVQERKTENVSEDRKRAAAKMVLRDRKSDEAYQDWLRQLRDRTYVEYKLEEK